MYNKRGKREISRLAHLIIIHKSGIIILYCYYTNNVGLYTRKLPVITAKTPKQYYDDDIRVYTLYYSYICYLVIRALYYYYCYYYEFRTIPVRLARCILEFYRNRIASLLSFSFSPIRPRLVGRTYTYFNILITLMPYITYLLTTTDPLPPPTGRIRTRVLFERYGRGSTMYERTGTSYRVFRNIAVRILSRQNFVGWFYHFRYLILFRLLA